MSSLARRSISRTRTASGEDVLSIADELNQRPRRILGYHTPAELFDHFLDEVYAIEKYS